MPLRRWFGTPTDHHALDEMIIAWGMGDLFELSSRPDRPLRRFPAADADLEAWHEALPDGRPLSRLHLLLRVRGAGPGPRAEPRPVTSGRLAGRVIEHADPTGCVLLHLEGAPAGASLPPSSTNTASAARLRATGRLHRAGDGTVWDIALCNWVSAALNRRIDRQAVARIGPVRILPGAEAYRRAGGALAG